MPTSVDLYWAAEPNSQDCASRFVERRYRYLKRLHQSGRAARIIASWQQAYGWGVDGARTTSFQTPSGERGELVDMATNDFAAFLRQALVMLTGSPPQWKSVVKNTDFAARAAAELADGLVQAYERNGGLEEADEGAVLSALMVSEGWIVEGWDRNLGRDVGVDPDTGQVVREGDVYFRSLAPWDVVYDVDCRDVKAMQWVAFRTARNRHDLIAWRPELKDKLLAQTTDNGQAGDVFNWDLRMRPNFGDGGSADYVDVWELRHLPTPALPRGRLLVFTTPSCVLFDSVQAAGPDLALYQSAPEAGVDGAKVADFGYPYKDLHCYPLAPERILGSSNGHTSFFDLLSLQQGFDTAATAMATATNAGGLTNWWMQATGDNAGGNVNVDDLAGGLRLIKSPTKPEVLEGAKVDPQAIAFSQFCLERMQKRLGLNDTALGETPKGMPAQLAALLQTQVVQFYSGLQRQVYSVQAAARTGLIQILQRFAREERLAYIIGSDKAWTLKPWKAEALEPFECVSFEPLGSVMRTQAGRMDFADKLLAQGKITGRQYLTLVSTGRLEENWSDETANLARIQLNKELMRKGVGLPPIKVLPNGLPAVSPEGEPIFEPMPGQVFVRPLITDTHWLDIPEYLSIINSPEARSDERVLKAVTEVVQRHKQLWRQMDPLDMVMLGCPPEQIQAIQALAAPPMLGAGTPPPAPGSSSGTPPPAQGGESVASGPSTPPIKLPSPPRDPMSGRKPPPPDMRTA